MNIEPARTVPEDQFVRELRSARASIASKLAEAHRVDEEVKTSRLLGRDASAQELTFAQLLSDIRKELSAIVDELQSHNGERWTPGLRASHFGRELRNARDVLTATDRQLDRLNFVTCHIADMPPTAPVE